MVVALTAIALAQGRGGQHAEYSIRILVYYPHGGVFFLVVSVRLWPTGGKKKA